MWTSCVFHCLIPGFSCLYVSLFVRREWFLWQGPGLWVYNHPAWQDGLGWNMVNESSPKQSIKSDTLLGDKDTWVHDLPSFWLRHWWELEYHHWIAAELYKYGHQYHRLIIDIMDRFWSIHKILGGDIFQMASNELLRENNGGLIILLFHWYFIKCMSAMIYQFWFSNNQVFHIRNPSGGGCDFCTSNFQPKMVDHDKNIAYGWNMSPADSSIVQHCK